MKRFYFNQFFSEHAYGEYPEYAHDYVQSFHACEYANDMHSLPNQHQDENVRDADHCDDAGVHVHTPYACANGCVSLLTARRHQRS